MPIHTLHKRQIIPATAKTAWDFFSNPKNLSRITPESLDFQVITPDLPERIHAGLMIEYRVRPVAGIPLTWLTEITHVEPETYFVDEQRLGPYALWHHEHWFRPAGPGKIEIEDRVTYRLPFGWLSEPAHLLFVRAQLEHIFEHRTHAVNGLFPATTGA